ncbi:MAG: hypothetical protein HY040_14905 [Planctomycetes bacterium]|nr:hypothetical protein [Planctomycetota bacterium]
MQKVAEVKKRVAGRPWMPAILRDVPAGHRWGWYSREEPRMHLQSVDEAHHYKVWLEENGFRIFEPVGKIPAKVLKALGSVVNENRLFIEDNWARFMLAKNWLALHIALPKLTLVAYPNMPTKFTRVIDLTTWLNPKALATVTPDIIELNRDMASLRLWTNRPEEQTFDARLSRLLWGNEIA